MAFAFQLSDPTLEDAFRRVALEQMDAALAEAKAEPAGRATAIHSLRKRCKRLRGLVRMVRFAFPDQARENAALRDAAAGLGPFRDADVLAETFAKAAAEIEARLDATSTARLRSALAERAERLKAGLDEAAALAAFGERMAAMRRRAAGWRLDREDFDALAEGIGDVYRRARRDMRVARGAEASAETFHDWRKQVKYHFHHLCLLREVAPQVMRGQRELANELGELLGEHHDIAVFLDVTGREPDLFCGMEASEPVRAAMSARQAAIGRRALRLGGELAGEKTSCLVDRIERYWSAWRDWGRLEEGADGPRDRTQVPGSR